MKKTAKKSQIGTLTAIILTLLVLVPVTFFAYQSINQQKKGVGMEACSLSILKASEQKRIIGGDVFTPLNCKRGDIGDLIIKKKDIVGTDDKINQNAASKIIADNMAKCWQMIGEGKRDPFSNWGEEGSYCLVCKTIRFDEELKKYYRETFTDKDKQKKRGKDGVITSPIPYLLDKDNKWNNGKNYFEYIYNTKDAEKIFSKEDIGKMNSMILADGSLIMIKLYKHSDKDTIAAIATWGALIAGAILIVVGVALSLTGAGAIVGVPLSGIGVTLFKVGAVTAVAGGILMIASGITFAGVAMFDPVNLNPFSECTECNGIGSLKLIPAEFDLRQDIKITYPKELTKGKEITEEGAYCDHLVN